MQKVSRHPHSQSTTKHVMKVSSIHAGSGLLTRACNAMYSHTCFHLLPLVLELGFLLCFVCHHCFAERAPRERAVLKAFPMLLLVLLELCFTQEFAAFVACAAGIRRCASRGCIVVVQQFDIQTCARTMINVACSQST